MIPPPPSTIAFSFPKILKLDRGKKKKNVLIELKGNILSTWELAYYSSVNIFILTKTTRNVWQYISKSKFSFIFINHYLRQFKLFNFSWEHISFSLPHGEISLLEISAFTTFFAISFF